MQTLNSFIDPKSILRDLNMKVNRIPDITTCPSCEAPEFYVGQDPHGGGWYTCNHCRWSGDSPQLLARAREITIEDALEYLKEQDRAEAVTPRRVEEYLRYIGHIQGAMDFWTEASDQEHILNDSTDQGQRLLHAYKLPEVVKRDTWGEGLGQFVGLGSRKLYSRYVSHSATFSALGVRPGQFLVSPMFDAPGRISALTLFGVGRGRKTFRTASIPDGTDDALMFLNNVYMYDDVVYATPDLAFAMCLQIWSFTSNTKQLPLLGFTRDSVKSWTNVRPQMLIFWDRHLHDELFLAARHVSDRAYIALKPAFDDPRDPYYHLAVGDYQTSQRFLGCMRQSAVPWLQALKDYLLSRDYGQAHILIRQLDLTPSHRQEMLKYCASESEANRLSALVDIGIIDMSIPTTVKNQYLVQQSQGWFLQNKSSGELTRVSSAIPVIETFTRFKLRTVLTGHIRAEGKNIPFEVDDEEFSVKWLEKLCRDNGVYVSVNSKIWRDFKHYAVEFHRPVEVDGLDVIGWDDTGFIFPRFAIRRDGRQVEHKRPIASKHPAQDLHLPNALAIAHARSWIQDTPAHAMYWALAAGLITNILAPALGVETRGLGLVSRFDDDRDAILQGIVDDMTLATYTVRPGKSRELITALVAAEHEHNVPMHVVFKGSPLTLQWMQDTESRNAVTLLNPGIVTAALLRGGWTILDYDERLDEPLNIPHGRTIMPSILTTFVKNGCKLPRLRGHVTNAVMELIRVWMAKRFGIEKAPVLDKATAILNTGTPDGVAGAGARFIGTLLYLLEAGDISICKCEDLAGQPDDKHAITSHSDWVYLNFHVINKAFSKTGLFMPDVSVLSQSFFESNLLQEEKYGLNSINGWYLNPERWNEEVKRWSDI